jgi:hypothetical protein
VLRVVLNIAAFQVAWWACVLSARASQAWIGIVVAVVVVTVHLVGSPHRGFEMWFIPLTGLLGYVADSLVTLLGGLAFDTSGQAVFPPPLWIAALWLAFATLLNTSFLWLRDRLLVAALVGATSGPPAYAAGAGFGIVSMPNTLLSIILLAVAWGLTLPTLVWIAAWAARRQQSTDAMVPTCTEGAA